MPRAGARHSRAFEALVVWAAAHLDKTAVAELCWVAWETIHGTVTPVVAESLSGSCGNGLCALHLQGASLR